MSPEPAFKLYVEPYTFRAASRPHGWAYCLRNSSGECAFHGVVFGPQANIAEDLPQPLGEWAKAGHLPYLPSPRPIREFGACHLEPRKVYIRSVWRPRRLPKHASEADRRIAAARS